MALAGVIGILVVGLVLVAAAVSAIRRRSPAHGTTDDQKTPAPVG